MGRYEIKPADGSRQPRKRIGRGPGSGTGKTAGKGHKGQKARSGYSQRAWFEGGQMPLQRRVPKRGFTNIFKVTYQVVNLSDLERINSDEVDKKILKKTRLIRSVNKPVKLLGDGTIQKKYKVTVDAFSVSAREAIEAAGGTCIATEIPKPKKKLVKKNPIEKPIEDVVIDSDRAESGSEKEAVTIEQEEPVTEEVTDEQEEPVKEEITDEQEEPVTEEVTDEQEESVTEEITDEQEEPVTEEVTDEQEEPVTETSEAVEEETVVEEEAVSEQETPVEEVEESEETQPEDED